MVLSTGAQDLRSENVSKIVTGFALQEYRMKQIPMVVSSNSWQETYHQETAADLTASGTRNVKGVSRLANFPYAEVTWTEKSKRQIKNAIESVISWEDGIMDNVDVISRTLLRSARAITKAVDDEIWEVLSEGQTPVLINTLAISAGDEWDSATIANRDPIQDILNAKKLIAEDNYNPDNNGFLLLNPKDFANLMGNANVRNAGQFFTDDVTKNGRVGRILGLTIVVSKTVTADKAMVVIAKESSTYQQVKPLQTFTITDTGIKHTIRSWEMGVTQLTNPEAVCLITNTSTA